MQLADVSGLILSPSGSGGFEVDQTLVEHTGRLVKLSQLMVRAGQPGRAVDDTYETLELLRQVTLAWKSAAACCGAV